MRLSSDVGSTLTIGSKQMYFALNQFFYYMLNQDRIETYIILESHGEHPHLMPRKKLKPIITRFIDANTNGVEEEKKAKYITYICDQLSHDNRF